MLSCRVGGMAVSLLLLLIGLVISAVVAVIATSYAIALVTLLNDRSEAQPRLQPTTDRDFAPDLAQVIAKLVAELGAEGFSVVASVHMPSFSTTTRVTQLLWMNRDTFERVNLVISVMPPIRMERLSVVTEFADGTRCQTTAGPLLKHYKPQPNESLEPGPAGDTRRLLEVHREHVARRRPPGVEAIQPAPGEEIHLIERRHAAIIRETLPARGWVLDRSGAFYRRRFRVAARGAVATMWPVRQLWMRHLIRNGALVPTQP